MRAGGERPPSYAPHGLQQHGRRELAAIGSRAPHGRDREGEGGASAARGKEMEALRVGE